MVHRSPLKEDEVLVEKSAWQTDLHRETHSKGGARGAYTIWYWREKYEKNENEEWHKFTQKSAHWEKVQKQQHNATSVVENKRDKVKMVLASRKTSDDQKLRRKQQVSRKMACTKWSAQQKMVERRKRQRVVSKPRNSSSEVESDQENEEGEKKRKAKTTKSS